MKEYYTTTETAEILNVTPKTIRNWDNGGDFIPDRRDGEMRFYSKRQIEERLGKTIDETIDPVSSLDKAGLDALLWLGKDNVDEFSFMEMCGDTIREKSKNLYMKIIQKSTGIYRKVGYSGANWLLASPEMAAWFEVATAGFAPAPYKEEKTFVKYLGCVNSRWKLYSTPLLDPDTVILGVKIGHELLRTSDAISILKMKDWAI